MSLDTGDVDDGMEGEEVVVDNDTEPDAASCATAVFHFLIAWALALRKKSSNRCGIKSQQIMQNKRQETTHSLYFRLSHSRYDLSFVRDTEFYHKLAAKLEETSAEIIIVLWYWLTMDGFVDPGLGHVLREMFKCPVLLLLRQSRTFS